MSSRRKIDSIISSCLFEDEDDRSKKIKFDLENVTAGTTRIITPPDADTTLVGENTNQILTNKTLDVQQNTLINIDNTSIKVGAGIDATKIASGAISSSEFQQLSGISGNIQSQIDNKANLSHLHAASEISSGTFANSLISEESVLQHQGAIDHGAIIGLDSDDHQQYLLLAGRSGGQTIVGGLNDGDDLVLQSTDSLVKGSVRVVDKLNVDAIDGDSQTTISIGGVATAIQVNGNLVTTGLVNGRDVAADATLYDAHLSSTDSHGVSGTIVGTSSSQTLINKTIDAGNNTITNLGDNAIGVGAAIDATKIADGSVSNTEFLQLSNLLSAAVGITDDQVLSNKKLIDTTTLIQNSVDPTKRVRFDLSSIGNATDRTISIPDSDFVIVGESINQVLINKTINGDNNTLVNLGNDAIKTGANIDVSKIGDGSITNTEFSYLDGLTGNIQTQIDNHISVINNPHQITLTQVNTEEGLLDTRGDMLIQGETGLAKLAVGPSGSLLISNGIDPEWGDTVNRLNQLIFKQVIATDYHLVASDSGITEFTASAGNQTIYLPDATTIADGWSIRIINDPTSTVDLIINDNGGGEILAITPGTSIVLTCDDTGSAAGGWRPQRLNQKNVITVSKAGGDYRSIGDAIDSITDASATNTYAILIGPGVFVEQPLTMKSYVFLIGYADNCSIIYAAVPTSTLITAATNSAIINLRVTGITTGPAVTLNSIFVFEIDNCQFINCDQAVTINATTADTIGIIKNCTFYGTHTYGLVVDGSELNTIKLTCTNCVFSGNAGVVSEIAINGSNANNVNLNNLTISTVTNGTCIEIYDGSDVAILNSTLYTSNLGIDVKNSGNAPNLNISGLVVWECNTDIKIEHTGTIGVVNGIFSDSKTVISSDNVSVNFLDPEVQGTHILGDLFIGPDNSNKVEVQELIQGTSSLGVLNGGELSEGVDPFEIQVSAGVGYILTNSYPNHTIKKLEWGGTVLILTASATHYIYVNPSNTVTSSTSRPAMQTNIYLGRVRTDSSDTEFIDSTRIYTQHLSNQFDNLAREGFGSLVTTGLVVSENVLPLKLDVTGGRYYYSTNQFNPVGGSAIVFNRYSHSSGSWVISSTDTVDNTQYDDGTDLTSLTLSNYVKHSLFMIGDGGNEKYFLIIGDNQFSSLTNVRAAELPTPPSYFDEGMILIASIIVRQGDPNIVEINDERPSLAINGSSTSGVTDHGALSGLADDDHPQYLLVNGSRKMAGDLDMDGGEITGLISLGTVDHIDFGITGTNSSVMEGRLHYDKTDKSLSYWPYTPNEDIAINLGQESLIRVKNLTGSTIHAGDVCYITGADSGVPTIGLAKADLIATGNVAGVAAHDIPSDGFITVGGMVKNFDTSGFGIGDTLYLSSTTAGNLTSSIPESGFPIVIGSVITSAVSGRIFVNIRSMNSLVSVSSNDTTPKNLIDAFISASNKLSITEQDDGGNEKLVFDVDESQLSIDNIGGTLAVARGGSGVTLLQSGKFVVGNGVDPVTTTKDVPGGDVVGTTDVQTMENKTLVDATTSIQNSIDPTKKVKFELGGLSTGVTRTITIPDAEMTLVGTSIVQTLSNKTLNLPSITQIDVGGNTLTLPAITDTLVGKSTTDVFNNKTLVDTTVLFQNAADNSKKFGLNLDAITSGSTRIITIPDADTTLVGTGIAQTLTNKILISPTISQVVNGGTLTLPTTSDTLIGRETTDTVSNKTLIDNSTFFANSVDQSKRVEFDLSSITAGEKRVYEFPDTDLTLVGVSTVQTLTNKTLLSPTIATIENSGTLVLPSGGDTVVARATTDTLSNKTLISPVISTINNGGTLTLPLISDTLVGRTTDDVLTNKKLVDSSTLIQNGSDSSKRIKFQLSNIASGAMRTITLPDSDLTLIDAQTVSTLVNKTISATNNTIRNIGNTEIKSGAAIDVAKIGTGAVTITEFNCLDGVASSIQPQIDGKIGFSESNLISVQSGLSGSTDHIRFTVTKSTISDTHNLSTDTGSPCKLIVSTEDGIYRQATVIAGSNDSDATIFGVGKSDDSGSSWGAVLVAKQNQRVGIATNTPSDTLDVAGNIVVSGTVDGRDVAADGATLDAHVVATSAHGVNGSLVGTTDTQSLTNKVLTSSTNTITCNALFSASTTVNVGAADAPESGQVLVATSPTTAAWQTFSGGVDHRYFYAYHSLGLTYMIQSWTDIPWDSMVRSDGGFTHSVLINSEEIVVTDSGWYSVEFDIGFEATGNAARTACETRVVINTGGGYSEIVGTRANYYVRMSGYGASASTHFIHEFGEGDKIKVQGFRVAGNGLIRTLPNGCRVLIKSI